MAKAIVEHLQPTQAIVTIPSEASTLKATKKEADNLS